jgi:hypothetical protein
MDWKSRKSMSWINEWIEKMEKEWIRKVEKAVDGFKFFLVLL